MQKNTKTPIKIVLKNFLYKYTKTNLYTYEYIILYYTSY